MMIIKKKGEYLVIESARIEAMDKIYTVPEVAEYLKMSKSKIYYLIQRREIPHIKIGRNVRIRQEDLLKWLDKKSQQTWEFELQ